MVQRTLKSKARARVVSAARGVAATSGITHDFSALVQKQVGMTRASFVELFPTQNDLLAAVHLALAEEAIDRLRHGVEDVEIARGLSIDVAAHAVVGSLLRDNPMDRSATIVRNRYRLIAIEDPELAASYAATNEPFVKAFSDLLEATMHAAGFELRVPKVLFATIITVWTERAFEEWIIAGNRENDFASSPFALEALPRLVRELVVNDSGAKG